MATFSNCVRTVPGSLAETRDPQFYNKAGQLTRYSLACGYIEAYESDSQRVTLWLEHNAWHVRAHDYLRGRLFWQSPATLTEARRLYSRTRTTIKRNGIIAQEKTK